MVCAIGNRRRTWMSTCLIVLKSMSKQDQSENTHSLSLPCRCDDNKSVTSHDQRSEIAFTSSGEHNRYTLAYYFTLGHLLCICALYIYLYIIFLYILENNCPSHNAISYITWLHSIQGSISPTWKWLEKNIQIHIGSQGKFIQQTVSPQLKPFTVPKVYRQYHS